jgi:predicted nucleotidyltransferase
MPLVLCKVSEFLRFSTYKTSITLLYDGLGTPNPLAKIEKSKQYSSNLKKKSYFCPRKTSIKAMSTQAMSELIAQYFKTQPVLKAWLFGSFSRGEETPESDVDILVRYDENARISLLTISHMMGVLEKLIHRRVDLVEEGCLLPFAEETANRDKILIYEREN